VRIDRERQRARIVGVAVRLADERGFDGLGLREVAEEVGLALGTLYKSFRNKEEILGAVVERRIARMRAALIEPLAVGDTAEARVVSFFDKLTHVVARYPAFARALLSALASNQPMVVQAILRSDAETTRMVLAAMRGIPVADVVIDDCSERERETALLLRQLWFASMVGWCVELHPLEEVVAQVQTAAKRLL